MQSKGAFRLAMKERLARLGPNDRRVESQIVVRELRKLIEQDGARSIGAYVPFSDEPDIRPLLQTLLEAGCTVSVPHTENELMYFVHIRTLEGVGVSRIGIPDPTASRGAEKVDERSLRLILVPGRAFTSDGKRMGRGNGGYDRWISEQRKRNPETIYVGVCFDCQLVQDLPTDPHDERMDVVMTPMKKYVVGSM